MERILIALLFGLGMGALVYAISEAMSAPRTWPGAIACACMCTIIMLNKTRKR